MLRATLDSLRKLDPRHQIRNPVMFVVEIGALITTGGWLIQVFGGPPLGGGDEPAWFTFSVSRLALADGRLRQLRRGAGRGPRQGAGRRAALDADRDRRPTCATAARSAASELQRGDVVVVEAGESIPGDGTVIEGIASVDESAITGESAPVIRESGGDRSAVTGGTRVLSDRIVVEITQEPGQSFLDRMIALVEGAERRKTPNEIALNILLAGLTLIFLLVVVTLRPFAEFANTDASVVTLIALLVALIPTTIGALLSAIGIAGMDRLVRRNVLALSGRSVEASGDVDVLLLDKTGTITLGNREATEFIPMPGIEESELAEAAQLSSLADETPEGRSIVVLAKSSTESASASSTARGTLRPVHGRDPDERRRRQRQRRLRKGAGDAIIALVESRGRAAPGRAPGPARPDRPRGRDAAGGLPRQPRARRRLPQGHRQGGDERPLRRSCARMGIRTVMVTGDNRLTAAKIAEESGVDDFLAEATPEQKLELIRTQQAEGRMVAMTGDGTNDAPALAQSDVGVAMNTGTQAAREAGNMVDLDSNPTKLIEIVEIGKQLLITRGALTTFSIANDVAKYFAILPAIFASTYAAQPGESGPARRAQHHVPGHAALGDPLGDRLQRAGHPAAGAARPARSALPADRRHGAAAPQHADLWPRRPDRAVHRDQTHRPRHPQSAGGLSERPERERDTTRSSSEWPPVLARPTGCCRKATPNRTRAATSRSATWSRTRRAETSALAAGLQAIPRRRLTYRDTELEEMDLPALLRAQTRAGADRRARPHQRSRRRAREALRGRRATCWRRESTSSRPSTSSTSSPSTTRSPS